MSRLEPWSVAWERTSVRDYIQYVTVVTGAFTKTRLSLCKEVCRKFLSQFKRLKPPGPGAIQVLRLLPLPWPIHLYWHQPSTCSVQVLLLPVKGSPRSLSRPHEANGNECFSQTIWIIFFSESEFSSIDRSLLVLQCITDLHSYSQSLGNLSEHTLTDCTGGKD